MHAIVNGKPVQPKILMAVLYDPGSGHIAHYHRVLQFDPKQRVTKAHVGQRTKEMATRHGWDVAKLKLLHVDPSKLTRGVRYQVDYKRGRLVVVALPALPKTNDPLRLKR